MKKIIFSLLGNELLANKIALLIGADVGEAVVRNFPDGETYIKINSNIKNKKIILVCSLNNPNEKFLPLYLFSKTAKELEANHITLISPYLPYMRQDKRFNEGEGVTSVYFASLISSFVDELITIDPHLHRWNSLSEIYTIQTHVIHTTPFIATWIKNNIPSPLLIGPDEESKQWVSQVASYADAPYVILTKNRKGDNEVEVSNPDLENYKHRTPVLVDDIISTAHTMMETISHLKSQQMKEAICIGVHAIFANNAYAELIKSGAQKIITCNTIPHESNGIDVAELIAQQLIEH
jgi:ribose-phosphate pyrophosphokinase